MHIPHRTRLRQRAVALVLEKKLTCEEAAKMLDCSPRGVRCWVQEHLGRTVVDPLLSLSGRLKEIETFSPPQELPPSDSNSVQNQSVAVDSVFVPLVFDADIQVIQSVPVDITMPNGCTIHLQLESLESVAALFRALEVSSC